MANKIELYDVLDNTKNIYLSNNALENLLDFERVLDTLDLYVFENWELGELIAGPNHSRYFVECSFMWPNKLMPNPLGAKRLEIWGHIQRTQVEQTQNKKLKLKKCQFG